MKREPEIKREQGWVFDGVWGSLEEGKGSGKCYKI